MDTQTETKHSPLPWRVGKCDDEITIWDSNTESVCEMPHGTHGAAPESEPNADLIVTAVNERPALLAELAALRDELAQRRGDNREPPLNYSFFEDVKERMDALRTELAAVKAHNARLTAERDALRAACEAVESYTFANIGGMDYLALRKITDAALSGKGAV